MRFFDGSRGSVSGVNTGDDCPGVHHSGHGVGTVSTADHAACTIEARDGFAAFTQDLHVGVGFQAAERCRKARLLFNNVERRLNQFLRIFTVELSSPDRPLVYR